LFVSVEVGDFNGSDKVVNDFYRVSDVSVNFLFFVVYSQIGKIFQFAVTQIVVSFDYVQQVCDIILFRRAYDGNLSFSLTPFFGKYIILTFIMHIKKDFCLFKFH